MSFPTARDMAAASTQAHAQLNGIQKEDAAKGAVVHSFNPNMSPEEKAAAAGKGRSELESNRAQERKEEARGASRCAVRELKLILVQSSLLILEVPPWPLR